MAAQFTVVVRLDMPNSHLAGYFPAGGSRELVSLVDQNAKWLTITTRICELARSGPRFIKSAMRYRFRPISVFSDPDLASYGLPGRDPG